MCSALTSVSIDVYVMCKIHEKPQFCALPFASRCSQLPCFVLLLSLCRPWCGCGAVVKCATRSGEEKNAICNEIDFERNAVLQLWAQANIARCQDSESEWAVGWIAVTSCGKRMQKNAITMCAVWSRKLHMWQNKIVHDREEFSF